MSWATRYKASITNQNQGGGNKKEGLPPSVGTGNLSVWNGMTRAYGTPKDRELQVCINQLGSVNPRVYQSRYCGRIKAPNSGDPRDCEPSFEMDINQWTTDTDVITSRYDICFIMDKSGSMGTIADPQNNATRWDRTLDFVKQFHRQLLLRQTDRCKWSYSLKVHLRRSIGVNNMVHFQLILMYYIVYVLFHFKLIQNIIFLITHMSVKFINLMN